VTLLARISVLEKAAPAPSGGGLSYFAVLGTLPKVRTLSRFHCTGWAVTCH